MENQEKVVEEQNKLMVQESMTLQPAVARMSKTIIKVAKPVVTGGGCRGRQQLEMAGGSRRRIG